MDDLEKILSAIESHSTRSLDIARANLEAAAVQAAVLEEQQKQTLIAQRREAIERSQYIEVGRLIQEVRLMLAAHQEVLDEFARRFRRIEKLQEQTMEFVKITIESGVAISQSQRQRLETPKRSKKSLQKELTDRYKSLELKKEQAAKYGINVPLDIAGEISFLEDEIEELQAELNEQP